jgi:integrase
MTAKRRGHGEGSIRRRADRRWEARLDLGYAGGKRKSKSIYGRTRAEVARKLRRSQQLLDEGELVVDDRITVSEWLTHWVNVILPTRVANGLLAESTRDSYAESVRLHIKPALGRHRLSKLRAEHVDEFIAAKREVRKRDGSRKYKPNSLRIMRSTLRKALNDAVRAARLSRNVVIASEPISIPRRAQQYLTLDEAKTLLAAVQEDRLAALYIVLLSLRLRRGKALALHWSDVDLQRETVTIRRSLKRVRNPSLPDGARPRPSTRLEIGEPKTKDSWRTQALPQPVVAALRAHRSRQLAERTAAPWWGNDQLVFTTPVGTAIDPANIAKHLSTVAEQAGLGHRNPHQLRHSAATIMLAQGVPLHEVSEVLGHSSITITKDVYGHLVAERRRLAADAMGYALFGRGSAPLRGTRRA